MIKGLLLYLMLGMAPLVGAVELPIPPPDQKDVLLEKHLKSLEQSLRNLEVVTSNPNGSQRGLRGDMVFYNDGTGLRFCRNTSSTPEGGTSWACDAFTSDTQLCFEGATENAFETCLSITDPTSDRTVTIPNTDVNLGNAVFITSPSQGDLIYRNASDWTNLAAGTSGQFLKTQGAGANPTWDTINTPAWIFVESLDLTTSVSTDTSATLPTTSDVFLIVLDDVKGNTGGVNLRFNADSGNNYQYKTLGATNTFADNTAQAQIVLIGDGSYIGGSIQFDRTGNSSNQHTVVPMITAASDITTAVAALRAGYSGSGAITSVTILTSGGNFSQSGKAHIFRLGQQ